MSELHPDPALDLAARALATVLDLEAVDLRADSPLDDLGADAVARVLWADLVEQLVRTESTHADLVVDDVALRDADTLGDLAAQLRAAMATS